MTKQTEQTEQAELLALALEALREVSAEISRLNAAAGQIVFNPAATSLVREVLKEAGARFPIEL